jgi:hypothetical protein
LLLTRNLKRAFKIRLRFCLIRVGILKRDFASGCCANASFSSRVSRATSVSWPAGTEPRRVMALGALRPLGFTALWRRALYQSSVRLTRLGFPNHPQHDSRWQTEGRLPWGLRLRCGRTFRARNFVAWSAFSLPPPARVGRGIVAGESSTGHGLQRSVWVLKVAIFLGAIPRRRCAEGHQGNPDCRAAAPAGAP